MLQRYLQLHRLTLTMNFQGYFIAGIGASSQDVCKLKLLIDRVDVVAVLIDIKVTDGGNNVTLLQPGFLRCSARLNSSHINSSAIPAFACILAQLRITRWKIIETNCGKPAILLLGRVLEKMRDNRSRDGIH